MHFTRNARKADTTPIVIKGQSVEPKEHTKILRVIMDARLKFQQHIPEAASKAMEAAMELKRLRGLSARTARQLFAATVTPVVDYASNVWMHAYKDKLMGQINRVQRAGAQAIVGTFMTVATSVAEAEAHIVSAQERFWKRAIKVWIEVAERLKGIPLWQMETITPVLVEPWRARLKTVMDKPADEVCAGWTLAVAVSSSARNGMVGVGGVIHSRSMERSQSEQKVFSFTLGPRAEQNPFSGELAAIAYALRKLPDSNRQNIAVFSRNKGVVAALSRPYQQSGQEFITCIYDSVEKLASQENTVSVGWDSPSENKLLQAAKRQAKTATQQGAVPELPFPVMKTTTLNNERRSLRREQCIPEGVGRFSKKIDAALPGSHTREIYEECARNGMSSEKSYEQAQARDGMICHTD
ncbi:hypothetical protein MY4038_009445 [Beauveria bassiana]